ncbi:mechanosensitive ion channel family protein [Brumimicrobium glaciale]|uniref:Mechanosensitive ion channel family protein n=1 Tax=Brumimicrobium glaciale TaxID=200475 RepID=A0A4Q4KP72_9FLAO|nr:mechanosensitive ion channel family protein [Brumimicrobium glaciale]RYM33779.1 mechanosensitive ion channel family protein [Brumimicrobium glaciale]
MLTFLKDYQYEIIYIIVTIFSVFALRFLTTFIQKKALKKGAERLGYESDGTTRTVRKILNTLWLILGATAIVLLFVSGEVHEKLLANSKFIVYTTIVAIGTIVFASTTNRWFKWKVTKKNTEHDDPTSLKFLRYIAIGAIYTLGVLLILLVLPGFKGVAQTVLGGAGVIAVIAGIASQEALGNIVSGLFIVSFKPFKIGDVIKIEGEMTGKVIDITLRHTVLQNFENRMIVVPNSVINKEKLINYDSIDQRVCERLGFNISYDSDIDLAKSIIRDECENHPLLLDKRTAKEISDGIPKVNVKVIELAAYAVVIRAWAWTANSDNSYTLRFDLLESIKKRFDKEGIVIPFPNQTISFKNPLKTEE